MRKKQAKPAKKTGIFVVTEDVRELDFMTFESLQPSSSLQACVTADPYRTTRIFDSFPVIPEDGVAPGDTFSLKTPKHEADIAGCNSGNCFQSSYICTDPSSLCGQHSICSAKRLYPNFGANKSYAEYDRKSLVPLFSMAKNSKRSSSFHELSTDGLLTTSKVAETMDGESPLKRLERCVRAKNGVGLSASASEHCSVNRSSNRTSTSATYSLLRPRANGNPMKLEAGNDVSKASAADALGELSQLVHRIGTSKFPVSTATNKSIPRSVASNVFTCLKCSQQYDTLDELVLHISTTKHFSRGSAKNLDAIAPWEKDRMAINFDTQLALPNILASLLYAQKCNEIPQDLSRKNTDRTA